MTLGAHPDLAFGPLGEVTQFLHLGMADRRIVGQRQAGGVEDFDLGAEMLEQALGFHGQQAAEGDLPQRAIEDQDTRLMGGEGARSASRSGRRR